MTSKTIEHIGNGSTPSGHPAQFHSSSNSILHHSQSEFYIKDTNSTDTKPKASISDSNASRPLCLSLAKGKPLGLAIGANGSLALLDGSNGKTNRIADKSEAGCGAIHDNGAFVVADSANLSLYESGKTSATSQNSYIKTI
jgi:hypothetical protein